MAKIARLYYERDKTQTEIAARLDLSQASVSRLLKRARDVGIVRTLVAIHEKTHPDLEEALQDRYRLKQAIVADVTHNQDDDILRSIGAAAAFYLETTLHPNEVVGISSWSFSLLMMVENMRPVHHVPGTVVLQILGGIGNPTAETHANHLTTRLARLIDGEPRFLPASGIVGSARSKEVLLEDAYVRSAVEMFSRVTLALVGVGSVSPSQLLASSGNAFSEAELAALERAGAVGDICVHFFDCNGEPVRHPLQERVIGMSLEQIRAVPRSVAVAGGQRKVVALRGCLRGGLVNVLVTDCFTARAILASDE